MSHNILFKSGHFRHYIIETQDSSSPVWGFNCYSLVYLAIVWIISVKSIPPCSLSVKPLIFLFRKHSLGYSQNYHKITVVLAGLPVSSPGQTQLLSTTICQLIALLFSVMP